MTQSAILELRNIVKRFGTLVANDDVSLAVVPGEILALLGENGAGKTTLMNILFGHYAADSGSIVVDGTTLPQESTGAALSAGIGMVHQHFTLADNITVLENILLGTESLWSPWSRRRAAREKLNDIIQSLQLEIDLDNYVSELSIGQRQRVEILKALYRDVRVLILDEPTAVLTPQEVDSLFELLRSMVATGMAVILISHKLNEVLTISDRVAVLRAGKLVAEAKTENVNRSELATMIVGRRVVRPVSEPLRSGQPVLTLSNISSVAQGNRQPLVDINLQVRRHEIVGIAGVAGNGQTELSAVLSGVLKPAAGAITFKQLTAASLQASHLSKNGAARIPEDRHRVGIVGEMSVWENLMLEDLGEQPCWYAGQFINQRAARVRAKELIDQFDIRCANMDIPASLLSGGNIQKLIFARNFRRMPDFVLANQPARGLDEGAIAFVHGKLLEARKLGAGVLLISEDLEELLSLADRVVVIHKGKLSESFSSQELTPRALGTLMTGGQLGNDNAL